VAKARQCIAERAQSTSHLSLDGLDADASDLGDLCVGQLLLAAENEYEPAPFREAVDCGLNKSLRFFAQELFVGGWGQLRLESLCVPGAGDTLVSNHIQRAIVNGAIQVRPHLIGGRHCCSLTPHREKHLLHNLLGDRHGACIPGAEADQTLIVRTKNRLKRGALG
jgi:hypothetical protein